MAIREGLLAALSHGARNGYQIKSDFETITGGVWKLNVGQVYTTLERLERDGLVEVDSEVEGKTYVMTSDGHAELARWWEATDIDSPPPRDELMLKILTALDGGNEFALKVVEKHRSVLTTLLQERRQHMRSNSETSDWLAMQLVNDALMFRAEADLRWLDQCESRILKLESTK
ncbi:MAG: hypothetical protein RL114_672 [Actinomycetota bacterium]|jgi:DNA-binding PadR family transcriptional regulator